MFYTATFAGGEAWLAMPVAICDAAFVLGLVVFRGQAPKVTERI